MKKYWGDTVCSECGKEIPYGVKRWCPKCNALEKIDKIKMATIIEGTLCNKIKFIGEKEQTYIGYPAELIKDLAKALIQRKDDWLL